MLIFIVYFTEHLIEKTDEQNIFLNLTLEIKSAETLCSVFLYVFFVAYN